MRHCAKTKVFLLSFILLTIQADRVWPLASQNHSLLANLIPIARFQRDFKITSGKDKGRVVALTSRLDLANDKKSTISFGDYATVHLVRDPQGILLMDRLDLVKSRNYVVYDPALPILPVNFEAQARFQRETSYRMFSSETGKLKRSGRVRHSVQRVSPSQFDTPAGSINGFFIEMDHRMDMEYMSELRITLGLGCREGEGPVFGAGQYKVTKLGVFTETKNAAAGVIHQ